jgi:hypothetical protein
MTVAMTDRVIQKAVKFLLETILFIFFQFFYQTFGAFHPKILTLNLKTFKIEGKT